MDTDMITQHLTAVTLAGLSPTTIRDRGRVLRQADAGLPLGLWLASGADISEWLSSPGWSPSTRATYRGHLAGWYAWLVTAGHLDVSPMRGVPIPRQRQRQPRPVADEILDRALADLDPPWTLAVLLAAYAGLRCVEISRLDREHVRERGECVDGVWLPVREIAVHGKGDRHDTVPCHDRIWEAVARLPAGPVVRGPDGARLTPAQVSNRGNRELARVVGRGVTMHRFRHWCATRAYRATRDPLVVARILRHSRIESTRGYALVDDAYLRDAVRRLGP